MNSRNMKNGAFDMELRLILQKIEKDTTSDRKSIHGDGHWERVAGFGRLLAEKERLNERVLVLFGYFHDCQRLNDGHDPEHGPRAAQYIAGFPRKLLGLTAPEADQLMMACRYHTHECESDDPVIRACWDADRLDLTRIGILPDPNRLFTQTAKELAAALHLHP
jgi:uncharacterized protein